MLPHTLRVPISNIRDIETTKNLDPCEFLRFCFHNSSHLYEKKQLHNLLIKYCNEPITTK